MNMLKSFELVGCKQNGWYWKGKKAIEYLLRICDEDNGAAADLLSIKTLSIVKQLYRAFYKDENAFIKEYKELLPDIKEGKNPEYIVFSHNDTQENNFLSTGTETKIIDFEYSALNYRGVDLASYIIESTIDYSVEQQPAYKIDAGDLIINFDSNQSI
jgi:thiamine kinase-like enzyme